MNKPKSFTELIGWVVVTPDGWPRMDTISSHRRVAIEAWVSDVDIWPHMQRQGWRVRKIRCTFYDHK